MSSQNMLSLSLVERPAFRANAQSINPRHQFPSRKYMSQKRVPQKASDCLNSLKDILANSVRYGLWSKRDMRSYIRITTHYIVDHKFKRCLLTWLCFEVSHTTENIRDYFDATNASYGITNKVNITTIDNVSNMIHAFVVLSNLAIAPDRDCENDDPEQWRSPVETH